METIKINNNSVPDNFKDTLLIRKKDILEFLSEDIERLKQNLKCMEETKAEHHKILIPYTKGQINILEQLRTEIQG